ncbi:MAG: helix-turn-helix domain-containing protein [Janibacter sp.]|nr:helix-turn-helix domain-containing protein [Janibacter sp.]
MQRNAAIAALGAELEDALDGLTEAMQLEMTQRIPELRGEHALAALLHESIHSNLSALARVFSYDIEPERVATPLGASEYARRLAQQGVSMTALVRAYRLGHRDLLGWALAKWTSTSASSGEQQVPLATVAELIRTSSTYIDSISEQVIAEYTAEREQWLAHRDRARSDVLTQLMTEDPMDLSRAEQVLGYRLRQRHLGLTLWSGQQAVGPPDVGTFQSVVSRLAEILDTRKPLIWAQDSGSAWAWLPLGPGDASQAATASPAAISDALQQSLREHNRHHSPIRATLGTPSDGVDGFRATLREARSAQAVATVPDAPAEPVTSYSQPGVRAASLLVSDLRQARRFVEATLGELAAPTARCARLRTTMLTLIEDRGSLTAAAERLHVHKNTVKYRLHQAAELRGRPIDEDRWDLELALHCCAHLGPTVLRDA